ncbi:MAG TPA: hypothetical protein VFB65_09815 [Pyrinomonadaceae bacterium]|nr:hypothetical protein [Pyrinomonadaceae bacterium]
MPRFSLLLVLLAFALIGSAYAQEPTAAETAEQIRFKLLDVQGQQEGLKLRLQELEEALKPENIERSLAGVGSTRPEELREARRRQLTIERDGVAAQLKILDTARQRLETALGEAEARAYHESARQVPTQAFAAQSLASTRWLIAGGVGLFALALIAGLFIYQRAVKLR